MNSLHNPQVHKNRLPHLHHSCVQAKLSINTPGDAYEQEADAVAERVIRMSGNCPAPMPVTGLIGTSVQRKCAHCEEEEKNTKMLMRKANPSAGGFQAPPALLTSINASKGSGTPLPHEAKSFLENAFSTSFSSVRIHRDAQANAMSGSIQAKAFTHGSDIYFSNGRFNPGSTEGKKLLAHELTHVLQQQGTHNMISRSLFFTQPNPDENIDPVPVKYHQDKGSRVQADISLGLTSFTVNGGKSPGAARLANLLGLKIGGIEDPPGTFTCWVDISAQTTVSAEERILTKPNAQKEWTGTFADYPNAACDKHTGIPVTVKGNPDGDALYNKVLTNENEHVKDIEDITTNIDSKITAMGTKRGTGNSEAACKADLIAKLRLGAAPAQTLADDFIAQWNQKRTARDARSHTLSTARNIASHCASIEFTIS